MKLVQARIQLIGFVLATLCATGVLVIAGLGAG
jgi:hypothetical protein